MVRKRKAIAMIELIFSLVILGIGVSSFALLGGTSTKGSSLLLSNQYVFEAAALMKKISTAAWDERNTDSCSQGDSNAILITQSKATELLRTSKIRSSHRRGMVVGVAAATQKNNFGFGKERDILTGSNEDYRDDIDDYDTKGESGSLFAKNGNRFNGLDKAKYKIDIKYIDDALTSGYSACSSTTGCKFNNFFKSKSSSSSNIKLVTLSIFPNAEEKAVLRLYQFMCNIGSALPLSQGGY